MDQLLVFPREAAEEQRGVAALSRGEMFFRRTLEVMHFALGDTCFPFEARPFLEEALLDHVLNRRADLDQVRGVRGLRFNWLSAHRRRNPLMQVILPL